MQELANKIKRRLDIIKRIDTPQRQAIARDYYRSNLVDFVNDMLWTFDPRVVPSFLPFDLFPKQEEYLLWRQARRKHKENGLCAKSRDMGVTYLNCAHQLHCWLFEDGFAGGFGSRKQDLVDRLGDTSSIFEKLRYMLRSLPHWLLPVGFEWKKHDCFAKLINPQTGSTITGECGDGMGRGGRTTFYDWDETAFTPRPQKVDAALSNNTDVIYYTSSANGTGNIFYEKFHNYPEHWVFWFHWTSDPRKDDAWFKQQLLRFDEVTVASEISIDFSASIEGIFIPNTWVRSAVNFDLPQVGSRVAGLDVASSGKSLNVFTPRIGGVVGKQISWSESNTTVTAFKARDLMIEYGLDHINFDGDGIGAGVASTFGLDYRLPFSYNAIRGGGAPTERQWEGENKISTDKFANRRAELWWMLRERFRKTYNHVNKIAFYPLNELISIPNDVTLIAQLSTPLCKMTSTGKILVESKDDMAKRGIKSPDHADSLVYSEEPSAMIDPMLFT